MPDVILEVSSLTVQLCPTEPSSDDAPKLEETSTSCEIWPAWDSGGNRFVTTHAGPADLTSDGAVAWKHTSSKSPPSPQNGTSESDDPLLAILVSVSPPGGIARIARQRLRVSISLPEPTISGGASGSTSSVLAAGEADLSLKSLMTVKEGQQTGIYGDTVLTCRDGGAAICRLQASICWVRAPLGVREIFGSPVQVPNSQCDTDTCTSGLNDTSSSILSPLRSPRIGSPQQSLSPGIDADKMGLPGSYRGKTLPVGRILGSPGSRTASRSAERNARKRADAADEMGAGPSLVLGGPGRSSSRERFAREVYRPRIYERKIEAPADTQYLRSLDYRGQPFPASYCAQRAASPGRKSPFREDPVPSFLQWNYY